MRAGHRGLAFRDLDRLLRHGITPPGDGALLACYVAEGDNEAFGALVARHGPMVRGVCRRLIRDPHDADDAFQAVFLVLVRKAKTLRDPDRLGPWLFGVASRVATKARAQAARRRDRPGEPLDNLTARDVPPSDLFDVGPILDAELARMPARLRDVLVACLLEGVTAEQAALRFGCPAGTVKSRLARGREALRARLVRRGISPPAALAALSTNFVSPVPPALTRATLELIASSAISPGIVALTRGVAPSMFTKSSGMIAVVLGGAAIAGLGTMTLMKPSAEAQEPGAVTKAQAPGDPARARAQAQTSRHMRMMLLAIHNYVSANDHLPPPANFGADGRPLLSWRVALLPYLSEVEGASALYNEFRQDEPWDSPHNKALIDRMPEVFETPSAPAPKGQTRLRGFSGPGTLFDGDEGLRFQAVTDGLSNTLMLALAEESVPWTQPGEMPYVAGEPLPALVSDERGHFIARADGSVRFVPKDETILRSLITRNGGEVVTLPPPPEDPPAARPAASPPPASPPDPEALERRLRGIEEKLDRVLKKLDALPGAPPFGGKP